MMRFIRQNPRIIVGGGMLGAASNQSVASYAAPLHSCQYRWLHAPANQHKR